MASKLKAKDPKKAEESRPKIIVYGTYGVSKTWGALGFPNVYFIDTEGGANQPDYKTRLQASGGVYMGPEDGSGDLQTIIEEVKVLATEKHSYKTLIIDSITKPYLTEITKEGERLGEKNGFGADKKPAVALIKRLMMWLEKLDMNIILICHEKPKWQNGEQIGVEADIYEKVNYDLDLVIRVIKQGPKRTARVEKSRLSGFPDGSLFPWTESASVTDSCAKDEFVKRMGPGLLEESKPVSLATPEQVAEITRLLSIVKIDEATIEKWHKAANAEAFTDYGAEQAAGVITLLNNKITPTTK